MIVFYVFLICAAMALLFLFEESSASRWGISLLLGICLITAVAPLLPREWVELIPGGSTSLGRGNLRGYLGVATGTAICYPLVAHGFYPCRNWLMEVFDRWYNKQC